MIYLGQIYTIKFSGCKYTIFVYLPYDHTVKVRFTQKSIKKSTKLRNATKKQKQKSLFKIRHSKYLERSLNYLYKPTKAY